MESRQFNFNNTLGGVGGDKMVRKMKNNKKYNPKMEGVSKTMNKIKKMLGLAAIVLSFIVISSQKVFAVNPDYGFVIVRCTGTLSIDVLDGNSTAWFNLSGSLVEALSANQTAISFGSITVRNDGVGILSKWAVWVASIQRTSDGGVTWVADSGDGSWSISDSTAGICRARLSAVFARSRPVADDFLNDYGNDVLANLASYNVSGSVLDTYTFSTGNSRLGPESDGIRYVPDYTVGSYHLVAPGSSRGLYFRIETPIAILDEYPRRFVIAVKAQYGAQPW